MQLAVLLIVHGACVNSTSIEPLLLDDINIWNDSCIFGDKMDTGEFQRLLRYLRCAASELLGMTSIIAAIKSQDAVLSPPMQAVKELCVYASTLEPRPESLQFQCRRVIRRQMSIAADGKSILDGIDDLPLPAILLDDMKLKDAE